jgi:DNA helicase-2/ATP-dependent DNA helicase PcrA
VGIDDATFTARKNDMCKQCKVKPSCPLYLEGKAVTSIDQNMSPDQVAEMICVSIDPDFYLPSDEQRPVAFDPRQSTRTCCCDCRCRFRKDRNDGSARHLRAPNEIARPDQILRVLPSLVKQLANSILVFASACVNFSRHEISNCAHFNSLDTAVTTYHSYAGRLLSEHAIRYGIDADVQPLGEAALWMAANTLVRTWDDGTFATSDAASTVVKDLLGLTSMVLEHRVTVDQDSQCG